MDGYATAFQAATALRDAMNGLSVSLVVYVRPQVEWLESVYLQGIQQGKSESPTEFWQQVSDAPNLMWSVLATVIQNGLGAGNLELRTYRSSDVVEDFFSSQGLGQPPHFSRDGIRLNRSIAPIQGPILRELLSDPEMDPANKPRLRRVFQGVLTSGAKAGFSSFSESQQQEMRDLMTQDLANLMTSGLMSSAALDAYGREVAMLKARPLLPWVESPESAESLWRESLRCIELLSEVDLVRRSPWARALEKLRRDPSGFLSAVVRNLAR